MVLLTTAVNHLGVWMHAHLAGLVWVLGAAPVVGHGLISLISRRAIQDKKLLRSKVLNINR